MSDLGTPSSFFQKAVLARIALVMARASAALTNTVNFLAQAAKRSININPAQVGPAAGAVVVINVAAFATAKGHVVRIRGSVAGLMDTVDDIVVVNLKRDGVVIGPTHNVPCGHLTADFSDSIDWEVTDSVPGANHAYTLVVTTGGGHNLTVAANQAALILEEGVGSV